MDTDNTDNKIISLYIKNMAGDIVNIKYNKDNDVISIYKDIKNMLKIYKIDRIHLFCDTYDDKPIELYDKDKNEIKDGDQINLFISEPYREKCILVDYSNFKGKNCLRCILDWYPESWDEERVALTLFILKYNDEIKIGDNSSYYEEDKWFKNINDAFIYYKDNYNQKSYFREKITDNIITNMIRLWKINHKFDNWIDNNDRVIDIYRYTL